MQERDHEFLLRVGIVPILHRLAGLQGGAGAHVPSTPRGTLVPAVTPSTPEWFVWPVEYVDSALLAGTLSKHQVLAHIQAAPASSVPPVWLESRGLRAAVHEVAITHTVASLTTLYRSLVTEFFPDTRASAAPRDSALRIQEYCRSALARRTAAVPSGGPGPFGAVTPGAEVPAAGTGSALGKAALASVPVVPDATNCRSAALALLHVLSAGAMGFRRRLEAGAAAASDRPATESTGAGSEAGGGGEGGDHGDDAATQAKLHNLQYERALQVSVCAHAALLLNKRCVQSPLMRAAPEPLVRVSVMLAKLAVGNLTCLGYRCVPLFAQTACLDLLLGEVSTAARFLAASCQQRCSSVAEFASVAADDPTVLLHMMLEKTAETVEEVEGVCWSHLLHLHALFPALGLSPGSPALDAASTPLLTRVLQRGLPTLVSLVVTGSPRIQQLAMRMCRTLLPHVSPNTVNAYASLATAPAAYLLQWPHGADESGLASGSFAGLLLHKLAQTFCVTPTTGPSTAAGVLAQPVGAGAGVAAQMVAAEACVLLRTLLQRGTPAWQESVSGLLAGATRRVATFVTGDGLTGEAASSQRCHVAMAHATAAFCVLGGEPEVLRCGGRFAPVNSLQSSQAAAAASAVTTSSDGSGAWNAAGGATGGASDPSSAGGVGAGAGAGDSPVPPPRISIPVASGPSGGAATPALTDASKTVINRTLLRVLVPPTSEGTVVAVARQAGTATVVFDSEVAVGSTYRTQDVPVATIVPVCEVAPSATAVPFSTDFLSLLLHIAKLDVGALGDKKKPGAGDKGEASAKGSRTRGDHAALQAVENSVVWRCQLKRQALQTLLLVLQHPPHAEVALRVDSSVLSELVAAALVPVSLPQFIAPRWLVDRASILRSFMLDGASGVVIGAEVVVREGKPTVSAAERAREEQAEVLASMMAADKALCVRALERNQDDINRAAEWLMGPQAEAFVRGGGLEAKGTAMGANARWLAARELGLVVGMPPRLCFHALEIRSDDSNEATAWLLEHGGTYTGLPWIARDDAADRRSSIRSPEKLYVHAHDWACGTEGGSCF